MPAGRDQHPIAHHELRVVEGVGQVETEEPRGGLGFPQFGDNGSARNTVEIADEMAREAGPVIMHRAASLKRNRGRWVHGVTLGDGSAMAAMSGAARTNRSGAGRSSMRSVQAITLHNSAIPSGSNRIDSRIIGVPPR